MAKVTLEVKNDAGEVIKSMSYELGESLNHIDLIESSVEAFRLSALPEISLALLGSEQSAFKKKDLPPEWDLSSNDQDVAREIQFFVDAVHSQQQKQQLF